MSKTTAEKQAPFMCPEHPERGPFKSQAALNTHKARMHGKGWSTTANLQGRKKAKAKNRTQTNPVSLNNLHRGGVPWSEERRAKFNSTWRSKNLARRKAKKQDHGAGLHHFSDAQLKELEKVGYANIIEALMRPASDRMEEPRQFINHCPNCGDKLQRYYLAAGFRTP